MGIFPDNLEQVYDNVAEHKIASDEMTPKLIEDWLEKRKVVFPVILCQFRNNLWKQWSIKNLTVVWKL